MRLCYFVSDLHGKPKRYQRLFEMISQEPPDALFLGGDLLPSSFTALHKDGHFEDFIQGFLVTGFKNVREKLLGDYPRIFIIPGNDDLGSEAEHFKTGEALGLWEYIHLRKVQFHEFSVYGYACVPPTPFLLKDWERYDVSRYVDPGCVPLDDGWRSLPGDANEINLATIQEDLVKLVGNDDLTKSIFLFHAPPYQTKLDRAALDGRFVDHVPLDVHVGSIAIKRFIENNQPCITLHGHIHESSRLTGSWQDKNGRTHMYSAAFEGDALALVRFNAEAPDEASRVLL